MEKKTKPKSKPSKEEAKKPKIPKPFLRRDLADETITKKIARLFMKDDDYISTGDVKKLRCFNPERRIWEQTGYRRVKTRAAKILNNYNMYRSHRVREVISLICELTEQPVSVFETTSHRITTQNVIFDLNTHKFTRKLRPEEYHIQAMPLESDAKAKCPKFDEFIRQVAPDNVEAVEEMFGWCLRKEYSPKTVLFLLGDTNSGRTVLLRVLTRFLGVENVSGVAPQRLSHRYMSDMLFGKLANICDDLPRNDIRDESMINMISGGGRIPARPIFGQPYDFLPYSKLISSTNIIPYAPFASNAFFGRTFIIDFPKRYPKGYPGRKVREEHIAELSTPEELSGIFNVAVRAERRLREQGKFTGDDMTPEEKRVDWRERASRIGSKQMSGVIDYEPLVMNFAETYNWPDGRITKRKTYREFVKRCKKRGIKQTPTKKKFGMLLKRHPDIREGNPMTVKRKDGTKVRRRTWIKVER